MTRDLGRLASSTFDLLIVGGGIHGLFAAEYAAARGLRVALADRDDFGSGLSFNHQRTVHGGLRSLQSGDVAKTREQIRERRRWALVAPAMLRPLPFLVPTSRGTSRNRFTVAAGLKLYDLVGHDRNLGLPAELHLPAGKMLSPEDTARRFPGLSASTVTGGAVWYDYQAIYPDRVNWLVALAAMRRGALLLNHVDAVSADRTHGRITGVRLRDVLTKVEHTVTAKATLVAAGSGLPSLLRAFALDDAPPALVAAANLLLGHEALPTALAAPSASGRMLTAVPWAGKTLVGTFQASIMTTPDQPFPLSVDDMLAEANSAFPALGATRDDVHLVHRGLTPARMDNGRVDLLPEFRLIRHDLRGAPGIVSLVGVKFTTARLAARAAVDALFGERLAPRRIDDDDIEPLPYGTPHADPSLRAEMTSAGLPDDVVSHFTAWYAGEARRVWEFACAHGLVRRVSDASHVIEGEIAYAAEHAMASRLADAVLRRTWLGATSHPGIAALERAADIMQERLRWTSTRRDREIEAVTARYRL